VAITTCNECGGQVSTKATACPKCGAVRAGGKGIGCGAVTLGVFVFFLLSYLWTDYQASQKRDDAAAKEAARVAKLTPEQRAAEERAKAAAAAEKKRRDDAVSRAAVGAQMLKKSMRNPDVFKLESALVMDSGAVCYTYRGQTGFGGMKRGYAALSADAKRFLTDEMDGFRTLWNRICANKSGDEVSTAINWFAL
jgi:hypothetical protein